MLLDTGFTVRGFAAFPTRVKWHSVSNHHSATNNVAAHADETDPVPFKDRIILDDDPFAFIVANTIHVASSR